MKKTEDAALFIIGPLTLFRAAFRPAIFVLNSLGSRVLRLSGLKVAMPKTASTRPRS